MYSQLKTAIKNHVLAITGIKNVYGFEKGDLNGYPSAIIIGEGIESEIDSTYENDRKYTFKIKVYQEISKDALGAEQAESITEGLIDSLIAEFEHDWTLGGLAYNSTIKGILAYTDRGTPTRVIEITLQYFTSVTIN